MEPYPKDRFYGDLMRVTEGLADPVLTELLVERSQDVVTWMAQHGVVWELHMSHCARVKDKLVWRSGTIPVAAREGGKGLMAMHFATVEKRGLEVMYAPAHWSYWWIKAAPSRACGSHRRPDDKR